jgi:hypothetical protein
MLMLPHDSSSDKWVTGKFCTVFSAEISPKPKDETRLDLVFSITDFV